jgi:hypothetical protein
MVDENQKIQDVVNKIFKMDSKKIIFIYTPPKVGSTTLVTSLRVSLGKSCNVLHIHDDIMLNVISGIKNIKVNEIINYLSSIGKEVFVIDVYRTPIERKMSEFFEKISPYHFNNSEDNISTYKVNRITDRFNKLFPHLAKGEHYFDKYDIQDPIPFDFNQKYTIQVINNIKYIKLRLCDSNEWNKILSKILNINIILINDYQTDTKAIGHLYKKFKEEYRLPKNYIELITNCKYFNFYYSEEERNSYINLWKSKLDNDFIPYSENEYKFYLNLCLENQYINDIQIDHYIDNGCYCKLCNKKRRDIYFKAKNGEIITEKLIHNEIINHDIDNRNKKLVEVIKTKISSIKSSTKFKPNQFAINHIKKR